MSGSSGAIGVGAYIQSESEDVSSHVKDHSHHGPHATISFCNFETWLAQITISTVRKADNVMSTLRQRGPPSNASVIGSWPEVPDVPRHRHS